jgi:hypothetical protein
VAFARHEWTESLLDHTAGNLARTEAIDANFFGKFLESIVDVFVERPFFEGDG